jgi:hypothetical protein
MKVFKNVFAVVIGLLTLAVAHMTGVQHQKVIDEKLISDSFYNGMLEQNEFYKANPTQCLVNVWKK